LILIQCLEKGHQSQLNCMHNQINVYIVEDHQVVIEGIVSLLQNEKELTVIGHSTTAKDCLEFFHTHTAEVILMDINLPDMNGIELCAKIKELYPTIMVLALSTFNQSVYINKMMESGASGYLLKNAEKKEIIEALYTVLQGKIYYSFEAGKSLKSARLKSNEVPILTKREKEILVLVTEGLTNSEIAKKLFISIDTVDTHRKNLYNKLGVKNIATLIKYALKNDLII
jgi:DNA-binding NarL/FixJ family response regulator